MKIRVSTNWEREKECLSRFIRLKVWLNTITCRKLNATFTGALRSGVQLTASFNNALLPLQSISSCLAFSLFISLAVSLAVNVMWNLFKEWFKRFRIPSSRLDVCLVCRFCGIYSIITRRPKPFVVNMHVRTCTKSWFTLFASCCMLHVEFWYVYNTNTYIHSRCNSAEVFNWNYYQCVCGWECS